MLKSLKRGAAVAVAFVFVAFAAVRLPADDAARSAASPDEIAEWIVQLDDDDFAARQAAQAKLEAAGKPAIEAVRQAALGESQEAAVRAIEILRKHLRGSDDSLKQAAEAALKKIAASDNAIAAGRANNALQREPSAPQPEPQPQPADPFGPRAIPFGGGGGIRIEARGIAIGGVGGRRISIKSVDGNKEIEVDEEKRTVKINESAEGKIKMEIRHKDKEGMAATESYEADSAEQLKKLHPEAHKIYEEFSKGAAAPRIEFRALPAVPGRDGIRIVPAVPRAIPADGEKRLEEARKRLEEARERMKRAVEEAEGLRRLAPDEHFEEAFRKLEEIRKQFEEDAALPAEIREQIKRAFEKIER